MARKSLDPYAKSKTFENQKVGKRESLLAEAGVDPNLLAMLAKKKKQSELTAKTKTSKAVSQRGAEGSALQPRGMPIDARQRAAMLMQKKIQTEQQEASGRKKKKKKVPNPNG